MQYMPDLLLCDVEESWKSYASTVAWKTMHFFIGDDDDDEASMLFEDLIADSYPGIHKLEGLKYAFTWALQHAFGFVMLLIKYDYANLGGELFHQDGKVDKFPPSLLGLAVFKARCLATVACLLKRGADPFPCRMALKKRKCFFKSPLGARMFQLLDEAWRARVHARVRATVCMLRVVTHWREVSVLPDSKAMRAAMERFHTCATGADARIER
jgi:hypothetical protein